MSMLETLAGGSSDDRTSRTKAFFGQDYIDKFLTPIPKCLEAIIPKSKVWEFDAEVRPNRLTPILILKTAERIQYWEPNAGVGSNNWAVDGTKTASGYPILAGDPFNYVQSIGWKYNYMHQDTTPMVLCTRERQEYS